MEDEDWFKVFKPQGEEIPLVVTAPHSGEWIPPETTHLKNVDQHAILTDIDRYVHELYDFVPKLGGWFLYTKVHRYAVDLNRLPEDVDVESVEGAPFPKGTHTKGFHWVQTTQGHPLMTKPMSKAKHEALARRYYHPFVDELSLVISEMKKQFGVVYHIDAHSMPSQGTKAHPDPGKKRKDIVLGDHEGKSCTHEWMKTVWKVYADAGFDVTLNDPYKGGRLSGVTSQSDKAVQAIQVELNRRLYMNETSRDKLPEFKKTKDQLHRALANLSVYIG